MLGLDVIVRGVIDRFASSKDDRLRRLMPNTGDRSDRVRDLAMSLDDDKIHIRPHLADLAINARADSACE